MVIDHVDSQIIKMIINGSQVTEIAEDTKNQKDTSSIDLVT